ncbi:dihydrodipicolinate synthase family protein [Pseudoalteromonas sp. SG45-5]|uniref:dihydrodipicolinate synthase family protein n=1 Tax=unclassified Pseudoalteromonas TaxID=194690 RepID=UPI0015F7DE2D|nr:MULTISPECIES: dihydrodipicolinate synthase family protein [unclassified Pseudoalteromonas]MBB1385276.1 dihydrodipicolinate synthase family protein [Pseudoalteromonas sp. SG45-5]MBB1394910.1 dihydrodipicolinate synthase family protein [Pseudoalteromonas sp. SG44-4]MBB1448973.1 dihydrodipicolinate synthase family protein [Pseudoalteromonas sp. SG41-6]
MNISGIIGYPITPFHNNGQGVDFDKLRIVIDTLLTAKVDAIAALGSAGEAAYLSQTEWENISSYTVKYVAGRVPVVIGIAELTTEQALKRATYAHSIGADVIMLSPFSYYKLNDDEIYAHYQSVSDATPLPIMIYNNPATCGVDMSPQFMLKMVNNIKNAVMIKESTGDIQRMHKIYKLSNGEVPFFNGCNHMALEALNAGAVGWCTAAPCLIGDQPKQLLAAVKSGNSSKAKELFYQQYDFLEFIVKSGLAAAVKSGFALQGVDVGGPRKPLLPLSVSEQARLKGMLLNLDALC